MAEFDVMAGNKAVAYGAKLSRVEAVPVYPITPQTTIIECIGDFIANGDLKAEYIQAEGEHTAMGMAIGASLAGARTFTASSSQGLAYMHECIAQAPAFRTPIVMAVVNRTLGWYWSLGTDYSDIMPELNLGWLVLMAESNQECLDTIIQLYRIAEDSRVLLPAMLSLDGFYLSYSYEKVLIPEQEAVDEFLPPYVAKYPVDPMVSDIWPASFVPSAPQTTYRRLFEEVLDDAKKVIEDVDTEFQKTFGRGYGGLLEEYRSEDAEAVLVTMGSMTTAARRAIDRLRDEGQKIGLVKLRSLRPFPTEKFRRIAEGVDAIGVVDRMVLHGTGGGGVFADLKSALYDLDKRPKLLNFIAGMGGEDVPVEDFVAMGKKTLKAAERNSVEREVEFVEHALPPSPEPIAIEKKMLIYPGSSACAGCGASIILRNILDVLGFNTTIINAPSCSTVNYPSQVAAPWVLANFAAGAGYATGIYRAYKIKGKAGKINVVIFSGDGGTVDIGLQSLSGAAERGESLVWICYDNEAYMNTGTQRSSSTPLFTNTTSTPVGRLWRGKPEQHKNMPLIMATHRIPYIATASIAYLPDLRRKVKRAAEITSAGRGLAYIHVQQPCSTGWYFPEEKTVKVARLAVETGAWPILEIEEGNLKINVKPKVLKPIGEYLSLQGRFKHLTEGEIAEIQREIEHLWETWLELEKMGKLPWY
jgi:pyruvate/2-oxoacid:ferredoxin oxidoreductase alpha subunit/pyruvate/2-oxoacid:ferredoxin oxidoreductase beta subunit